VLRVGVAGESLVIHQVGPPAPPVAGVAPAGEPDVVLEADRDLLRGAAPRVVAGGPGLADRFAACFVLSRRPTAPRPAAR